MAEEKKSYQAISEEVRQLAQQVEGVALSGAQLAGGKRKGSKRKGSKKSAGASKRKGSRKGSSKGSRKGSKRKGSKKSKGMQSFGTQLINLGLRMQNLQLDGGKKKAKKGTQVVKQASGILI